MKKSMPEMGEGRRIDILNAYIDEKLITLKTTIDSMPKEVNSGWNRLNELFLLALDAKET